MTLYRDISAAAFYWHFFTRIFAAFHGIFTVIGALCHRREIRIHVSLRGTSYKMSVYLRETHYYFQPSEFSRRLSFSLLTFFEPDFLLLAI